MKQSGYLLVLLLAAVVISGCTVVVGDSSGDVGGWIYVPAGSQMSGASAEIEPLFLDQATPPYGYEPAVGVTVRVAGRSTKTNYEGRFYFMDIAPGGYTLTADGGPLRFAVERQVYVRANTITWLGQGGTAPIYGGIGYYIVIGIDKYSSDVEPLPGPRDDALAVYDALFRENRLAGLGRLLIRNGGSGTLAPTKQNIWNSIQDAVDMADSADDYLVIYFSGRSGQDHLVDPSGTWITDGELESWVRNFPGNVTLILDGSESATMADGQVLPMAFRKNVKYTVLAGAQAGQDAWHDLYLGNGKNSVFTHFLLQGIKNKNADSNGDGDITARELYLYTKREMLDYSGSVQVPDIFEGYYGDSVIYR